jgi:hypothetical protein
MGQAGLTDFYSVVESIAIFGGVLAAGSVALGSINKGSYVLSSVHAISMLYLTSYVLFSECGWESALPHCEFDSRSNSEFQHRMLLWSVGYFIVDSVVVLRLVPDYESAFHHVTIVVGQMAAICTGTCGYALSWFLFLAELSAPFLNCFMSGLTIEGTPIDLTVKSIFSFTFIISRLLICPFMTYKFVFECPNVPLIPKGVCLCVMAISLVWGKRIVGATITALRGGPANTTKGE